MELWEKFALYTRIQFYFKNLYTGGFSSVSGSGDVIYNAQSSTRKSYESITFESL